MSVSWLRASFLSDFTMLGILLAFRFGELYLGSIQPSAGQNFFCHELARIQHELSEEWKGNRVMSFGAIIDFKHLIVAVSGRACQNLFLPRIDANKARI